MARATVPLDRTGRQPITGFCLNEECAEEGQRFEFPIEHADVSCPKCGLTEAPMVGCLTLIHFMVKDNRKGPIIGSHGRYKLACDPARVSLATPTNLEAATDQLEFANCPQCVRVAKEQGMKPIQGKGVGMAGPGM